MQSVRLAPDFFRKERNQAYRNWRSALWRELVQNAVDAKCSRIDIHLTEKDTGFELRFADNGPGMSREVLENVYFAVGATTKTGGDTVGGMGRARMLTCFSMNSYRIRSHDYIVNGHGGEYDVVAAPFFAGCALDIEVDNYPFDDAISYLNSFLASSNIRALITINDGPYLATPLQRGRHVRNLVSGEQTFGYVYVNKSATNRRVIVRVNGVTMFTQSTNFEGQIIVELVPEISRSVLTSNRDGLRGDYSDMLNGFLTELSVNTKSAMRGARQRRTTRMNNGGFLRLRRQVLAATATRRAMVADLAKQDVGAFTATSAPVTPETFETVRQDADQMHFDNSSEAWAERWISSTFGDVFVTDETDNAAVRKTIVQYLPQRWTVRKNYETGKLAVKGGTIIKLLLVWKVCVTYALEIFSEVTGSDDIGYAFGFLFDDEGTGATHRSIGDGSVFSLAPVDRSGKLAYAITQRGDLLKLMSLAKHEVTHMAHSWHNESFTTMREEIDFKFDQAECLRRIKDAIRSMPF
jgi:hypothetical protein